MLEFLERLLKRAPEGTAREKRSPARPPHDGTRSGADQNRDDFATESERLRSSNRIIGPGG